MTRPTCRGWRRRCSGRPRATSSRCGTCGPRVDALPNLEDVPVGYWPMIIVPDVEGAAGIHLDQDGQPYALIEMSDSWSLTASHEMLEMLADPFGNRVVAGRSLKRGQGRVEFLVEVCDPSEAAQFGYTVNDILVSDFYTPRFFDPAFDIQARYSFTGAISKPRQVLRGGYVSWHDPVSNHWWQQTWFGARKEFRDLGEFDAATNRTCAAWIDANTEHPGIDKGLPKRDEYLKTAVVQGKETQKASAAKAKNWREQIGRVIESSKSRAG